MKKTWTPERIKEGFEKFACKNKRLPTASEVDILPYLPSSRYIQKRFGGLEFLRKDLGYSDTSFSKGIFRGNIAQQGLNRSTEIKLELYEFLQKLFELDRIEPEKTFLGRHRVDYYICAGEINFGIDIFYAETMRTLQSSVNIKMKKYIHFSDSLYLVVANNSISQKDLDLYLSRKKYPLPPNILLITLHGLHKHLKMKKKSLQESSDDSCSD